LGVILGAHFKLIFDMDIKRNILFSLKSRKKNGVVITDNLPVRMRVVYAGRRVELDTGYWIGLEKWDARKQRVKNRRTNKFKQDATEINTGLLNCYTDVQDIFKRFEAQDNIPTPEQLKEAYYSQRKRSETGIKRVKAKTEVFFYTVFDGFVKECGSQNKWGSATYRKFDSVKNHLKAFDEQLTFDKITEAWLTEYVNYMSDVVDMRNSSIEKQMEFLRWFLRWAVKKGYNSNLTFETCRPNLKSMQKKVIFLTMDELNLLRDCQIPEKKKYLERVRDVFLFCCFTGLRYSDVYKLKRSDIKKNHIKIKSAKTGDSLVIELNKHSKAILEKYTEASLEGHKALPVINNQNMNNYIKELGELAGINEPIRETYYRGNKRINEVTPKYALLGTHVGRRTFIYNALLLGIPPQVVIKWTGHSDYKAIKPYMDIADDAKANAMDKFDRL
jgi:integrase